MREFSLFSLNYSDRHSGKQYCPQALGRLPEITYLTKCSFTPRIVPYAKIVQCGDLGSNGSHLPPPSGCFVQNGVQTVFDVAAPLCCAVLVLGTWWLVSCSLWSWGSLSMFVFIPLLCSISKAHSKNDSNSLLRLPSYSDLDYQVWSDVLHTTELQQSLTLQLCVNLFSC